MTTDHQPALTPSDSAAVFACALSLWNACHEQANSDKSLNLSDCFNGIDQLMREVMRVGYCFEEWSCQHINFDDLNDVWPYMLEDKFGKACLQFLAPSTIVRFGENDCLRVALRLRLPVITDDKLPVPVDLHADNPVAGVGFRAFRIQTVRNVLDDNEVIPFVADDDPFDEEFGKPYYGLYGVAEDDILEHIADRKTYAEIIALAKMLVPEIRFSKRPLD